jgi:filamentous hemagglutinin family protein
MEPLMPRLAYLTAQIRAAHAATYGATLLTTVLATLLLPLSVEAAPVDPVVRAGTATFAINGNVYTVTNTPNTIIDWRQFNVANGELLRFLQQNPQSVVLNRVTGTDPSQLFGLLQSNGRVVLVNPNGILFGPNASVDVAGLIASTLNLSDADFLAGRMAFNGGGGLLQNQGRITTPLGGSVMLVGGDVTNSGVITAPGGRILLAAGQSVSLADTGTPGLSVTLKADGNKALNLGELNAQGGSIDMYGALVEHSGMARADSAAIDAHGNIVLKAATAATVSGTVSATGTAGSGGTVQVLGDSVALAGTARIDASGRQGGGTVLVGGDLQGANPAVQNARTAAVAAGARIDASATGNGDGGKVVVWSNDKTDYAGSIVARGGAQGGNGGQVETSGKQLSFDKGSVNTLAPKGRTGNWLLDPAVFCFYVSSASECTGAAAAGATDFNTLGNILVSTGGTLQATDFVTFLPAGGNAAVSNSVPAGLTLNVKAPYIQLGNGSNINTRAVGLRLDASSAYGTTTQTDTSGANLTGTIAIGGDVTSNASQTLISTGNISIVNAGSNFAALRMTSATGTQSLSTAGQLLLQGDSTTTGQSHMAALFSDGGQTINAGQLILRSGNNASVTGNSAEIDAKGSQVITASAITLDARAAGFAIIGNNATGGTQTIKADRITLNGAGAGTDNRAVIVSTGDNSVQDITATTSLDINGGAGGVRNFAIIKSAGGSVEAASTQKITAGAIKVTGGGGVGDNYASIYTPGAQNITASSISITGGNSGTATSGLGPYGEISSDSAQTIKVTGALNVIGGTGDLDSSAVLYSGGNQNITAGSLLVQGGATGKGNSANVSIGDNHNVTQSITANSITLQAGSGTGNFAGIHADGSNITQTVTATSLTIKGGGGTTSGNWAHLWVNDTAGANTGKQTITAGTAALTGGSGGTDQNAMIGGNAEQRVTADAITLAGGAGVGAGAAITTEGNQTVVVKNGLAMTGGSNNNAEARLGGSGTADITADSITLQGGSAGTRAIAEINGVKNVTINVNGAFTLTGGTGGTNNMASAASSANLAINAGTLALSAGSVGSGNGASLNSSAAMTVKAKNAMTLTGGAEGSGNSATLASAGNQTLEAASLSLTGGPGGSGNHANISINGGTDAVQKVTAATLTMLGGQGGSNNIAGLHANGTRVTQDITATTGLTLTAGNGPDNWAHIAAGYNDTTPSTQRINSAAITLTGSGSTAADAAANALILNYGAQTIKGGSLALAANLTSASVENGRMGTMQSIELTGALTVTGGKGNEAWANVSANGGQNISADSITITGGAAGIDSAAYIQQFSSGSNDQTVSANRIALTGGGGQGNAAGIYKGAAGKQTIVIKGGGSLTVQGGSGDALPATGRNFEYCNGCKLSSNGASIYNGGSSQTVDFVSGGTLTLTGGTRGSDNAAIIIGNMDNGGTQTITSSGGAANYPAITLTGGSGGFYNPADGANVGNVAAVGAFDTGKATTAASLKTINAKSITLNGGGTANERGGALLATGDGNSIINVTGDLLMNGGSSSVAFKTPTTPATAYWLDFGSIAGITARGNVNLNVGGNLVMRGGTGSSSPAGILLTKDGKLTADIKGATRIEAGASVAGMGTGVIGSDTLPAPGTAAIDLSAADSFTTSTFAASGKYFELDGIINVTSSAPDATLVGSYNGGAISGPGWRALGAKPIVAEIFASDGIEVGDNAAINTPNGSWIAVLGKNAAASMGSSENTLTYNALASHGYQWTTAAYNSSNAQEFRFILPDNSPIVETHADEAIAQTACTSNPALCVTPPIAAATPASAVAPVVIDVKLTGGVDETPLSASLAQNKADTPAATAPEAPAPKVQGPRVAAREKEAARAEEQKKSTADLKREARDAGAQAKASQEAARKAALAAQKEALEAKRIAAAAAKTEAQAVRATAAVGAAEGDLRAAEADARDARAALAAAGTPALKNQAQLRLATAEAARAGAEAKLADARAKRAELGAQGSETGARSAQADAVVLDARSREAAAEAKLADLAHKEALVRAREAKDPVSRAAAERLADDKRIEATQRAAESDVRKSIADDLRFASEQAKAQADARQAQAQAAQALAQARRDEVRLQRAVARVRQEEVLAGAKGAAAGRTGQGGKDAAEKLVAAESKRAEASQAVANAKAQAAEAKQRKADEGMAQVARRDDARRERAVKAFVAGANASMTASQLAQLAALRHEYKGLLFKDALKVLEQNGRAADLPACGGNISNTCMPSFAQARMEWPTARPLVRKPVAASLPQIERKVAIVIGINRYADKRIAQLDTAVPDADAVARQLEESMGYETRVLRNATKSDIVAALQNVARELDPNDSLVVYYAGHGFLRTVPKGPAQGYWIPADGAVSSPSNWISNADVSKLLANIPAKQVMLVSDSCYSGTFSREQKVSASGDASAILAKRSVTVMSSGGEEPVSDEGYEGHSIFAWSLLQSMKKVGQVEPGSRVFESTREQVTATYPQVPQYGAAVSAGHVQGGDYLFETRTYK